MSKVTIKSFLFKSQTKAARSAEAFIAAYREFLVSGELAEIAGPILVKLDSAELLPTPALEEIRSAVLAHHLANEVRKGEERLAVQSEAVSESPKVSNRAVKLPKNYTVDIVNSAGDVIGSYECNSCLEAERVADRKLFSSPSDCHAVVVQNHMLDKKGNPLAQAILREKSIGRILKKGRGPVMKGQPRSSGSLTFGMRAKQDHCHFSRG